MIRRRGDHPPDGGLRNRAGRRACFQRAGINPVRLHLRRALRRHAHALPRPRQRRRAGRQPRRWSAAINQAGPLDFVAQGGDIANREEETELGPIQSAATSWAQFEHDYIDGLTVTTSGRPQDAALHRARQPRGVQRASASTSRCGRSIDKTALVEIYNRMMTPPRPKTAATYDYAQRSRPLFAHARRRPFRVHHDLAGLDRPRLAGERSPAGRSRRRRSSSSRTISPRRRPSTSPTRTAATTSTPPTSSRTCSPSGWPTAPTIESPTTRRAARARAVPRAPPQHHRLLPRQLELERVLRLDRAVAHAERCTPSASTRR